MKRTCIIAVLVFHSVATLSFSSMRNERRGFILGLGIGASFLTWSQDYGDGVMQASSDFEWVIPICTDIRIGFGLPNNRFIIYYWNKVNWFQVKTEEDASLTWNGLHALAASYYFNSSVPSVYVNLGIGLSSWRQAWHVIESASGLGVSAGVGYEFQRHWSVEAALMFTRPKTEYLLGSITTNTFAISLCIVGILY